MILVEMEQTFWTSTVQNSWEGGAGGGSHINLELRGNDQSEWLNWWTGGVCVDACISIMRTI